MSPAEQREWVKNATLKELVNQVIWESVMEGTSHCGWTDRARGGLCKSVLDSVNWAIDQKLKPTEDEKATT